MLPEWEPATNAGVLKGALMADRLDNPMLIIGGRGRPEDAGCRRRRLWAAMGPPTWALPARAILVSAHDWTLVPAPPAFDTALAKIVRRNRTHSTAAGRTDQPTAGGFFFGAVFSFNSWSAAAYSRCASSHSFAAFSRRCPARRNPLSSRSIDWATRASDHIRISTRNPFTIEIVRLFSVLSTDGKRRFARTNGYGTNRS
jgi:hypothetical protein